MAIKTIAFALAYPFHSQPLTPFLTSSHTLVSYPLRSPYFPLSSLSHFTLPFGWSFTFLAFLPSWTLSISQSLTHYILLLFSNTFSFLFSPLNKHPSASLPLFPPLYSYPVPRLHSNITSLRITVILGSLSSRAFGPLPKCFLCLAPCSWALFVAESQRKVLPESPGPTLHAPQTSNNFPHLGSYSQTFCCPSTPILRGSEKCLPFPL